MVETSAKRTQRQSAAQMPSMIEDVESENILEDSAIHEPEVNISSSKYNNTLSKVHRLTNVCYSVIASKQKPSINDTVTSHIEQLTRYKNSAKAHAPSEIYNKYNTTTALAEKRNQDFEDIH